MINITPYIQKLEFLKEYMGYSIEYGWMKTLPEYLIKKYPEIFSIPTFEEFYQSKINNTVTN